jgi:hypothetical protein
MYDRRTVERVPAVARNFSLFQSVQTGTGVHVACYSKGTEGFPGIKRRERESDKEVGM